MKKMKKVLLCITALLMFVPSIKVGAADVQVGEIFNKVAPNLVFEVGAIKPKTEMEADTFVNTYVMKKYNEYASLYPCNDDFSVCTLTVGTNDEAESHEVQVKWAKEDSKVMSVVKNAMDIMEADRDKDTGYVSYLVKGLEVLNFYSSMGYTGFKDITVKSLNVNLINYSNEIKEKFDYAPLSITYDLRQGSMSPIYGGGAGFLTVAYEDVIYGYMDNVSYGYFLVIYIDDATEDTPEAYMTAAEERINNYYSGSDKKFKVTLGDVNDPDYDYYIEQYNELEEKDKIGDMAKYYYMVSNGTISEPIVIVKNSSKVVSEVGMKSQDIHTNISISANNASVPVDTTISVEKYEKDSDEFKELDKVLELGDKESVTYDLSLYSESTNQVITDIKDGEFEVTVPLTEELKGKNLVAYYVDENDKKIEYEVTIEDDEATFYTNHFSIYTIAEKTSTVTEQVPNTYDGITNSLLMGLVGLLGLVCSSILVKDKKARQ